MQYESFMHRIYIRTWWYNTTYNLYGSMILLHLILSNYPDLPDEELLEYVEKSLEIFSSTADIIVARRCADMLREALEVARACLARRRHDFPSGTDPRMRSGMGVSGAFSPQIQASSGGLNAPGIAGDTPETEIRTPHTASGSFISETGHSVLENTSLLQDGGAAQPDDDFLFSLFS
ncbi:transcriptional regulator family: Fungal Specific TF [Penicillium argentinense]|uniref:Transcriptional regulator family: Fungal Specific TF n=1 Tax=Penicillium argentinense TaxID=1131581 RepID=A0A9W9G3N2_9EURO|nr:transcriptional regulator family: Fungal Specific TF [Penicillium argentinense]KAJ5111423.1 transcriptional regulator family: Fungal Specific TF [Penicillium argentinense]